MAFVRIARLLATLAFFSLLLPAGLQAETDATKPMIIIDPGHGGRDDGFGNREVMEKTLALDVSKRLERILRRKGYRTILTRRTDRFIGLDERAKIANRYPDGIFISVHFNSFRSRSVRGIETFYYSQKGKRLAAAIQRCLTQHIQTRNRGTKVGKSYAVLRKTIPVSCLVECGFLSNSWERARCQEPWYRQIVAEQIAVGIGLFD